MFQLVTFLQLKFPMDDYMYRQPFLRRPLRRSLVSWMLELYEGLHELSMYNIQDLMLSKWRGVRLLDQALQFGKPFSPEELYVLAGVIVVLSLKAEENRDSAPFYTDLAFHAQIPIPPAVVRTLPCARDANLLMQCCCVRNSLLRWKCVSSSRWISMC